MHVLRYWYDQDDAPPRLHETEDRNLIRRNMVKVEAERCREGEDGKNNSPGSGWMADIVRIRDVTAGSFSQDYFLLSSLVLDGNRRKGSSCSRVDFRIKIRNAGKANLCTG